MLTGMSPQNSHINWRHAPQGGVSISVSVKTAMALNPRSPSLTALKIATRSAQMVSPYVAFSTLQPAKIRPDVLRKAAPTRKLEYGACAFSRACLAASISKSFSVTLKLPDSFSKKRSTDRFRDFRQYRFQQGHKIALYARRRLQNFPVIQ